MSREMELVNYEKLSNWGLVTRIAYLRTPSFVRAVRRLALAMVEACDKRLAELGEKT